MDDLIEFLNARYADEERIANAAAAFPYDFPGDSPWERARATANIINGKLRAMAPHEMVAVFADPARVLADIAAKRAILARHDAVDDSLHYVYCAWCSTPSAGAYQPWPCPDLRDLAQPYASHPDFLEQWRVAVS
uniref:DUF6221 family protein n=1 Tax=Paractinoplanes polyasparticus TaxID=2856853 RepID=UPI001C863409|nr:DUF6221 family protein [Actinoplanes polyasparticus]